MFLVLALLVGAARGEEPGDPGPPTDATPSAEEPAPPPDHPEASLQRARTAYLMGQHEEAADQLRALLGRKALGEEVPDAVWCEALVYLGEIQYLAGDRAAAEAAFRRVLEHDPTWRISPYDHPMDIIGAFEFVRDSVQRERSTLPPERHPYPWWGYAPLGVPQFKQGQPGRGAAAAVLQVAFAGASVGAWVAIDQAQIPRDAELTVAEQQRSAARATLLRDAVSIPTATAFYLTWGASVLDGGLTWRKGHAPAAAVLPRLDRPGLWLVGRF